MKILTEETCPHCKKGFESQKDLDNIEPVVNKGKIKEIESTSQVTIQEEKPIEKIIEKIKAVAPKDQPFFECKDGNCGDKMHTNPNYKTRPNKKCKNCESLNGGEVCKNCGNTDKDEFDELDEDELNDLGIPTPKNVEHEHNHGD